MSQSSLPPLPPNDDLHSDDSRGTDSSQEQMDIDMDLELELILEREEEQQLEELRHVEELRQQQEELRRQQEELRRQQEQRQQEEQRQQQEQQQEQQQGQEQDQLQIRQPRPRPRIACPECNENIRLDLYDIHHAQRHVDIVNLRYRRMQRRVLLARNHEDELFHCLCGNFNNEDACTMHFHASDNCEFSDPILQQQRPIADQESPFSDLILQQQRSIADEASADDGAFSDPILQQQRPIADEASTDDGAFSDPILQQQKPIADEESTWHDDQPPSSSAGQEEEEERRDDTEEQDEPASSSHGQQEEEEDDDDTAPTKEQQSDDEQEEKSASHSTQQDDEDAKTSFMETTIMVEDELSEWEQQSQAIKSKATSMTQRHEKQSHHMNEQFASLSNQFDHIMQDQAQHSYDMQQQLRVLLHSLCGNNSALFSTPQHHRLEGLRQENARKNWIRLLVKYHLGRKLENVEIESALQGGEISSDIQAPDVLDMIDYVLAFIFELDTK
ncbi:predicted protein [Lichtheimia corymbifera JMRC:FSU:9682]|uniref:Uncharacterized protein n=1 Tax=Lichtheimia corymbifera JMRC:FSU:9682 TaxID=1263082 RepID=A0A068SDC5_9FUNG|nr:predicted protein [Lichtheimia corymbifera JMRC:FSU:9682]CDH60284.1 predicted protein [Lichtheimia corymbifera JMRC:FSU:9682]